MISRGCHFWCSALFRPIRRAATPAAYGAAKLVPWSTQLPPLGTVETMSTPGAAMSTKEPAWEKGARSLLRSEAPTARTLEFSKAAGYMLCSAPLAPPLPAEATIRTPLASARVTAARRPLNRAGFALVPWEMLMMSAPAATASSIALARLAAVPPFSLSVCWNGMICALGARP